MLEQELVSLRFRLDALQAGQVRPIGLWERALELLQRVEALSPLADLATLDRELDQVGVHTSADALLLRQLSTPKGRAGALAQGLTRRATAALLEYRDRLQRAERALAMGRPIPGAATLLADSFRALARAAKVADLFSAPPPRASALELLPRPAAAAGRPPERAAVAVADFWAERARQ